MFEFDDGSRERSPSAEIPVGYGNTKAHTMEQLAARAHQINHLI